MLNIEMPQPIHCIVLTSGSQFEQRLTLELRERLMVDLLIQTLGSQLMGNRI